VFLSCNRERRNLCFLTVTLFIILTPYITKPPQFFVLPNERKQYSIQTGLLMELTFNPQLRHGKYMRATEGLKALPSSTSTGTKKKWPNKSAKFNRLFPSLNTV